MYDLLSNKITILRGAMGLHRGSATGAYRKIVQTNLGRNIHVEDNFATIAIISVLREISNRRICLRRAYMHVVCLQNQQMNYSIG